MNNFERRLTDTVSLIKPDGQQYDGIKASVQSKMIFIADISLPIEERDRITRKLPNGLIEEYLVLDRGYMTSNHAMMNDHYQIKVRKETSVPIRESSTTIIETFVAGDQFNQSGNFQGANLNIKSVLTNATQTINNISNINQSHKDALTNLMLELEKALAKIPSENAEDAEAIAEVTQVLIEAIAKEKPNKSFIKIMGDSLKKAAENITHIAPVILPITIKIVEETAVSPSSL